MELFFAAVLGLSAVSALNAAAAVAYHVVRGRDRTELKVTDKETGTALTFSRSELDDPGQLAAKIAQAFQPVLADAQAPPEADGPGQPRPSA